MFSIVKMNNLFKNQMLTNEIMREIYFGAWIFFQWRVRHVPDTWEFVVNRFDEETSSWAAAVFSDDIESCTVSEATEQTEDEGVNKTMFFIPSPGHKRQDSSNCRDSVEVNSWVLLKDSNGLPWYYYEKVIEMKMFQDRSSSLFDSEESAWRMWFVGEGGAQHSQLQRCSGGDWQVWQHYWLW